MIAARDRSGRMLSVFHNRRWDWDLRHGQGRSSTEGWIGRPAAVRERRLPLRRPAGMARQRGGGRDDPPRLGRAPGRPGAPARPRAVPSAGRLADRRAPGRASTAAATGGSSWSSTTSCSRSRPAGSAGSTGPGGGSSGPTAASPSSASTRRKTPSAPATSTPRPSRPSTRASSGGPAKAAQVVEDRVPTVRAHWDEYYRNIAEHLAGRAPLAVTAEQAREVVRVLEAAALVLLAITPSSRGPGAAPDVSPGPSSATEILSVVRITPKNDVARAGGSRDRRGPPGPLEGFSSGTAEPWRTSACARPRVGPRSYSP